MYEDSKYTERSLIQIILLYFSWLIIYRGGNIDHDCNRLRTILLYFMCEKLEGSYLHVTLRINSVTAFFN